MKKIWQIWFVGILFLLTAACSPVAESEERLPAAEGEDRQDVVEQSAPIVKETSPPEATEGRPTAVPDLVESDTDDLEVSTPVVVDPGDKSGQPATGRPGDEPMETVDEIIIDLSRSLGVAAEDVELVALEEVTWSDSGLGCPVEGMMYMQVLTPGRRAIMRVNGVDYYYHAGGSGPFRYCPNPQSPVPPPESDPGTNQPSPGGGDT